MQRKNTLKIAAVMIVLMVALRFVRGGLQNPGTWLLNEILLLPGIVIGLSFHEFGHAWMSNRLGDPTPKAQGRLTINPLAHIDWIGFLCLLFAGFGWGIPVQIDPRYYKKPRRDEFLVSIAGVVMTLIIAVVFSVILRFMTRGDVYAVISAGGFAGRGLWAVTRIVYEVIVINVVLMIFNLFPLPPLDGFGIVTQIFNLRKQKWYWNFYQMGTPLLLFLLIFNVIDLVLTPCVNAVLEVLFTYIVA